MKAYRIQIITTRGTKFFDFAKFNGGWWFVLNLIPKRFGFYFEVKRFG